jgi:hypothetical protein
MATLSIALAGGIHTGACVAVPRAIALAAAGLGAMFPTVPREREYCLHDEAGRPVGVIRAPAGRPTVGAHEPSVYLQRPG